MTWKLSWPIKQLRAAQNIAKTDCSFANCIGHKPSKSSLPLATISGR